MKQVREVLPVKLKHLLSVSAVVQLPFGLGAVLAPNAFLSLFGATLNPAGVLMMQFGGAWLIGLGLLAWLIRDVDEPETRRSLVTALLVMYVVASAVALLGQLAGALNALGWMLVALNGFLTLSYGYFAAGRSRAREATPAFRRP
jgi:hypothetical protein